MKAARMYGIRDIRIDEIPRPEVGEGDALVAIKATGICGSDVHYYTHGRIGRYVVAPPFVLGHECAGIVEETGPGVTNVKPGDRVAVEPGVPCRMCTFCKQGKYHLCREVIFLATPPYGGSFQEYTVHAADFLFSVPDSVSLPEAAMVEPLSTGMQAVRRSGLKLGDRVFIAGVGPIGLATLQAFKAGGAGAIYVSDMDPERLRLARDFGAAETFDAKDDGLADRLRDLTEGFGPEITVETAGSAEATKLVADAVRPGGVAVLVGLAPEANIPFNVLDIIDKEIDVRGVFRYSNTYPAALSLIARGAVDVKRMITAEYRLEDANRAMSDVADGKPGIIKAVVTN